MAKKGLTETITLQGHEVTIHKIRVRDATVMERLKREAAQHSDPDSDVQSLRENIYPALAACSEGKIPTMDEFVDMDLDEGGDWFDAVYKINPGLLPQPTEEDEAKKES